ncbi:MAG: hypothetical protein ACR2PH_03660, partial [Desulfobulbia bacterium]
RDMGAEILKHIMENEGVKVQNSVSFAGDSLFCEWAYLIDLDNDKLEVYVGFNRGKGGRFQEGDMELEKSNSKEYSEAIGLIKTYDLSDLPNEEEFCKELDEIAYPEEEETV